MPNYSGLGGFALAAKLREDERKQKEALGLLEKLENERSSFDPSLGEFNMMDRARQLGLTGKYSEVPEVKNYLSEPFSSSQTKQNIDMVNIELGNKKRAQEEYEKAGTAIEDYISQLALLDALGERKLSSENEIARETLSPYGNDARIKQIFDTFVGNANDLNMADMTNKFKASEREARQQFEAGENEKYRANARYIADANLSNSRVQNAALRAAEFDVKEKDMLSAVEEGKYLLSNLVDTFKKSGFGGAGSAIGEATAKVPLVGKYAAGKYKEYQNQKRLAAETWLRAATGAAAPKHEVDTYTGFLPSESDPPEIADKKIQNFFDKIAAKAEARAKIFDIEGKSLEQRGMVDLANTKYTHANLIRQMIQDARKGIPTIQEDKGKTEQPTSASKYLDEIRARRAARGQN
jgi:hypothetical protein